MVAATISWQPFRLPLRSPFGAAHGSLHEREGLLVHIVTPDGEYGRGEASPLPSFAGGGISETAEALATIAKQLRGQPLPAMWGASIGLDRFTPGSAAAARCGFETALADLLARREGLPLWRWLARGQGRGLPPGPASLPVNAVIDASVPAVAAAHAREFAGRGFRTLKVKVAVDIAADAARLAAIREAVGPAVHLRADANGGWKDHTAALAALESLAPFDIALCEQPLPPSAGLAAMAALGRQSLIALAIDEGCRSLADLHEVIRLRAAAAVVIKPMVSGLREALAMLSLAAASALPAIVTTTFDSGVAATLAAHLAALLPAPRPACGLATVEYLQSDIVASVPAISDGFLELGEAPGLGVTVLHPLPAPLVTGPRVETPL